VRESEMTIVTVASLKPIMLFLYHSLQNKRQSQEGGDGLHRRGREREREKTEREWKSCCV
jgi:hypothetical protein